MSKFFSFATEEMTNEIAGDVDADAAIEASAEAEAASDEVVSETGDIAELQAHVEEAIEGGDTLADVAETMQVEVEEGEGLSEQSAKMATIAVESVCSRLGLPIHVVRMPAAESFAQVSSRKGFTSMAVESVVETLKKIWNRIKAFAKSIWEKIQSLWTNLTKNYDALLKQIAVLKARSKNLSGDKKNEKLSNKSLAKAISNAGKADKQTYDHMVDNAQALLKAESEANTVLAETSSLLGNASFSDQGGGENAGAQMDSISLVLADKFDKALGNVTTAKYNQKSEEKGDVKAYGPVSGGRILKLTVETLEGGKKTFKLTTDTIEGGTVSEATALTVAEIGQVLNSAEALARSAQSQATTRGNTKKVVDAMNKLVDRAIASIGKTAKSIDDKQENVAGAQVYREAASTVQRLLGLFSNLNAQVPAMVFATCRDGVNYASASMSNIGKKD